MNSPSFGNRLHGDGLPIWSSLSAGGGHRRHCGSATRRRLRLLAECALFNRGIAAAARVAIEHLTRSELEGFFIHVDADCLDDAIMPAVDCRLPGGLSWDELRTTLEMALASGEAVGIEIAIYNPRLDKDGAAGRGLTDVLARALGGAVAADIAS